MDNLKDNDFENLLLENNTDSIRDFLLENGKEGKVYCPISFEKQEDE